VHVKTVVRVQPQQRGMLEKTSGGAAAGRTTRTASPGKLGMDDAEASWRLVEPFIGKQQAQFTAWIRPCWKRSPVPLPAHLHPLSPDARSPPRSCRPRPRVPAARGCRVPVCPPKLNCNSETDAYAEFLSNFEALDLPNQ